MTYLLTKEIQDTRYRVFDVPPDGDCLFAAFAYGLERSLNQVPVIRAVAVERVGSLWHEWGNDTVQPPDPDKSIEARVPQPYPTYEEYRTEMSKKGTFGGKVEILAMALEFNRCVRVFEGDRILDTWNAGAFSCINLEFLKEAKHYRCLIPEEDFDVPRPRGQPPVILPPNQNDDFHYGYPEANNLHLLDPDPAEVPGPIIVEPYNYDEDMFADCHPVSFPIGCNSPRPRRVRDLPEIATGREVLTLSSAMGNFYMWAGMFANETAANINLLRLGAFDVSCPDCKAKFWRGERLVNNKRNPAWCCGRDYKTEVPADSVFKEIRDPVIRELFVGTSERARHFQDNIRAYNNALCCAVPVTEYSRRNIRSGHVVSINGRVEFQCSTSVAPDLSAGQLYFVNMSEDVTSHRLRRTEAPLQRDLLVLLERYLRRHNDLIRTFELAGNLQRDRVSERVSVLVNPKIGHLRATDRIFLDQDRDAIRPPGSNFVAAAYIGTRLRYSYDVLLFPKGQEDQPVPTHRIHEASPSLDTLLYPLIHLHAEDPWLKVLNERQNATTRPRLESTALHCGTVRDYYASRIMERPDDKGVLFQGRSLFQQWLCDAAVKIEDNNLRYAENHNVELNVCQLDSLRRFVESEAETLLKQPGRVVIIPPHIQTSERAMYNDYMDSICISSEFGPVSMLLTFTTNPRWPEITERLAARKLGADDYVQAPDAVVRCFTGRLNHFIGDVVNKNVFGRVLGYAGVNEFTTTMLPHFHLAVILDPADVPSTANELDAIVSAEIPPEATEPEGYLYVMKHMIHRPCDGSSPGYTNPQCRPNGVKCTAGFPYDLRDETIMTRRGPLLRRREIQPIYSRKYRCMVDNRWVIPYNLKMGLRHGCHLNLMVCGGNTPYKYLFGYFRKEGRGQCAQGGMLRWFQQQGDDEERVTADWDEIKYFQEMRVVGPYEAVYKILGLPISRLSHTVETLPVHLPRQQYVYYRGPVRDIEEMPTTSKLEAWFDLNRQQDSPSKDLLYSEIPGHYVWENSKWRPRIKGGALGRLMHVNPSPRNMELFHLRLLLLNRPGATSYRDLLTVDGVEHATFGAACNALGVGEEGLDYEGAMDEIVSHAKPYHIRNFFATLVAACSLNDAETLWRKHRVAMSDDYSRRGCSPREALVRARRDILRLIHTMIEDVPVQPTRDPDDSFVYDQGRRVPDLLIPAADGSEEQECTPGSQEYLDEPVVLEEPLNRAGADRDDNRDQDRLCREHMATYTDEQMTVHRAVMASVGTTRGTFFSLMAAAGCGKTHLYKGLVLDCKQRNVPVVSCAMTAIAALLIPDADTCHKTFGIPIRARQDNTDRSFIEMSSPDADRLRRAGLIVVDEVSMMSGWQANLIDKLLKDVMNRPDLLFGGKTVLFGGDMGQILPVMRNASSSVLVANSLPLWEHWPERTAMSLTRNMRAENDAAFSEWVSKVRDGSINVIGTDSILVPPRVVVTEARGTKDPGRRRFGLANSEEYANARKLIKQVYGEEMTREKASEGIIVAPTNQDARTINNVITQQLKADSEKTYYSKNAVVYQDRGGQRRAEAYGEFIMAEEELNKLNAANLPPHALTLKIGSVVMLLININKKDGLCNGARFIVTGLYAHSIRVERLVPVEGLCNELYLPKMRMRSDDIPVAGCITRLQFPVSLGFAITINKSQGQTFKRVGIFLRKPVFSHGQFYVAVSRALGFACLYICVLQGLFQGPEHGRGGPRNVHNVFTKNIVYPQVLQ